MATNKDRIYKYIQKRFLKDQKLGNLDQGVQTEEVVKEFNIKRPNASALLNKLIKDGLLTKTHTRPVYYRLSERVTRNAFDDLIGSQGSLAEAIRQAKAAINFPQGPLPIHIVAKSGSGTSYFSKILIQYAKDQGILSDQARLYEINCMFLADQPTKLNQSLFGDEKQSDIFHRVKKSIILISHYEKLDQSQSYRLQHILESIKHDNLIILTTVPQNLKKLNLIIQINLPSFSARPFAERLAIIEKLFENQAQNSGKAIVVSANLMISLAQHNYQHGFKGVEKTITLASAKAYMRSLDDQKDQVYIANADLDDSFIIDKTLDIAAYQEVERLIGGRERYIFKGQGKTDHFKDQSQNQYFNHLYQKITTNYQDLSDQGLSPQAIQYSVYERVKKIFDQYGFYGITNDSHQTNQGLEELGKIVTPDIITLTQNYLKYASKELDKKFDNNLFYGLCLHLNSLINLKSNQDHKIAPQRIAQLKINYPQELQLTQKLTKKIKQDYGYHCTQSELVVLLSFLVKPRISKEQTHPVVLYALHGNGAAHQISKVINNLNHADNTYAYDMQLDKPMEKVYGELKSLVKKIDQGKGIIVIYDMGSFSDLFQRIANETNISIRLINIPITLVGLEVGRKSLIHDNLDDIYHNAISDLEYLNKKSEVDKQDMIITLCHTGEGGAVQAKDYIEEYSHLGLAIKAMSISDRDALADEVQRLRKIYHIRAFIGTYNPKLFGIPFISLQKIFENKHQDLDKVLSFLPVNTNAKFFDQIYSYYQKELKYTAVDKLKETMPQLMEQLEDQYQLNKDQQIGVFTHIVGIIENIHSGKERQDIDLTNKNLAELNNDIKYLSHCLKPIEKNFDLVFNISDLYTIIAILKKL